MTGTWPLPCMNKSGHSGHLRKAMPGQLITVNHPSAAYEGLGNAGRGEQGSPGTKRNGQGCWETVLAAVTTLLPHCLLLDMPLSYPRYSSIDHSRNDIWLSARVPARRVRSSR